MLIATVQDLPTPRRLALMLAAGVLLLAIGAAFTRHLLPEAAT